jgi:hypothetical protein
VPTIGNPRLWLSTFSPGLVPQIIDLVLESWTAFDKPKRGEREVPITRRFCSVLKQRKNALRELPVRIDRETPDDSKTGEECGRIDIRFTEAYSCREDVYFAFECKRLNLSPKRGARRARKRSLAGEYVSQGMMRFVTGQYAPGLKHGGMIGYVVDGDVASAVVAVSRSVLTARRELKLSPRGGLRGSRLVPGRDQVKETFHRPPGRTLRIQHVFLACC